MPIIEANSSDNFDELYKRTVLLLGPLAIHKRLAEYGTIETKDHLRSLSMARDSGSRFYENYAKVTHPVASESIALTVIPPVFGKDAQEQRGNPLAAHYYGYSFSPANLTDSKYFTIPAREEARHRRAREFPDLKFLFHRVNGKAEPFALAQREQSQLTFKRGKDGRTKSVKKKQTMGGLIMFWLVKRFRLKGGAGVGDKSVLPTEEQYATVAEQAINDILKRLTGAA